MEILDRWNQIEQLLNRLLERLYAAVRLLVSKKTPGKVKTFAQKTQSGVKEKKQKTRDYVIGLKGKVFIPIVMFFKNFGYHVSKGQQKIRNGILQLKQSFKSKKSKSFKERLALIGSTLFLPLFVVLKDWLSNLRPLTLAISISLSTLLGLTILNVYTTQMKLQNEQNRAIASNPIAAQEMERVMSQGRPDYYKQDERFVKILNIDLPIYIKNVQSMRSLRMDFVMIPSNRYIREYFYEHEYLVQDRLNVMIEPTVPEMPLDDEGRRIIREKIRDEMNGLLDDLKIKGKIEEVYIDSILGV